MCVLCKEQVERCPFKTKAGQKHCSTVRRTCLQPMTCPQTFPPVVGKPPQASSMIEHCCLLIVATALHLFDTSPNSPLAFGRKRGVQKVYQVWSACVTDFQRSRPTGT